MTSRPRVRVAMLAIIATITTLTLSLIMPAVSFADTEVPASCPVTLPSEPAFIPPGPYPKVPPGAPHSFWHGASGLWTMLDSDGVFKGGPTVSKEQPGVVKMRNKSLWWSPGFHPMGTPEPTLKIEGRRLDGDAPSLPQPWVTNAHDESFGGWTMLTMLELPPAGCWEVTGSYGADYVTFVVWVAPPRPQKG
jgi:hypothetical protein